MSNLNCKIIFVRHGESTENIAINLGKAYDKDNIKLTEKGINQAKLTGKYLLDIYKQFDCVISSPIHRCVQTSNLIMDELNQHNLELYTEDLLIEDASIRDIFAGLSKIEQDKILNSDTTYNKIIRKIRHTRNPYDKYNLDKIILNYKISKYKYLPTEYDVESNIIEFLSKLKKIIKQNNYTRLLVITHSGVISKLQKIICNIDIESNIFISDRGFTSEDDLLGNCACACISFSLNNGRYKLISPSNTNHLT
jgi:broad specificity phosphatase PhoE